MRTGCGDIYLQREHQGNQTAMKLLFPLISIPLLCSVGWAQTPTLVQHVTCPNSRNTGNPQTSTPDYSCPLPEPSQGGNALLLGVMAYKGATFTVSDDKSNAWTLVDSVVDDNSDYIGIYVATNVAAGTRLIRLHRSAETGNVAMSASEYYNIAQSSAVDAHHCNIGSNTTSISAGNITPAVSGDLLWQWAINDGGGGGSPNSTTSFTVGSQQNIKWQFNGTDIYDGDAVQAGVYTATGTINPTFASGSAQDFVSCVMALKAANAGKAPSSTFRIVHMLHQQMPASAANPWPIQFPSSGNLIVISALTGKSSITGVSSTPSNTWSSTGSPAMGGTSVSQIYYAAKANTSNALTLSVARNNNVGDSTFMMYDFVGALTSPFDVDSGGQSGEANSIVGTLTTCNSCITPTGTNEVVIANFGQEFCTATGIKSPSGGLFDAAIDTGNDNGGPQSVDQNNGWMHYYVSSPSAITATWSESCKSTPQGGWGGRMAAFKGGQANGQPLPPTGLNAVVR